MADFEASLKRACRGHLRPLSLPPDWKELIAAEMLTPTDTLYDTMVRLGRRLREEDYEATTGLR